MSTNETQQILHQLRTVIRRRKRWIAGCAAAAVVPVVVYNQVARPLYEASAALAFDEFTGPVPSLHADNSQEILTSNRVQELSSRSFAGEIVDALAPETLARFRLPDERPPGFDAKDYIGKTVFKSMTATAVRKSSMVRISVRLPDPELCADVANEAAQAYQARNLRVQQEGVRSIRVFIEDQLGRFRAQLDEAEQSLRSYKETQRISSFEGQQQEVLRRLTDAEVLYNAATTNREALEKQLKAIEDNLSRTKENLVPSVTEVASPRMQKLQEKLVDLQLQYAGLQVQDYAPDHPKMVELGRDIEQTKKSLTEEAQRIAAGGNVLDPLAQLSKYGDERLSLQMEIESSRAREQALQQVMRQYEATLGQLPEKELRLARLTRERDVNQKIYNSLLEKLEETKISEAENLPSVRIVDVARPDPRPIRPRKGANLVIGLLVGLIGGTGIALVRESSVASMESLKELEAVTGWPALATLPRIHQLPPGDLGVGSSDPGIDGRELRSRKRSVITLLEPGGGPAEAYRMLRTNLKFRGVGDRIRTVAVTSTEPNEGKTTIVSNLAISFATMGDRVLVLDAEVRRAGMHKIFGVPESPGLADLLAARPRGGRVTSDGEVLAFARRSRSEARSTLSEPASPLVDVRAAIHATAIPNLWVLPAGSTSENPTETLSSHVDALRSLLEEVRGDYDVVVLDTPPLAVVHDTAILARLVDGVVFVVNARRIDHELLSRSRAILERAGARVVGALLNLVEPTGVYRSNAYYYRYRENGSGRA